ncbi:peptidylprolyl isomerase [bacterium]|nr:peptidylprolyl isomerase [bacterium]|tara:strand:- start:17044 stop:17646 length:603 start_codon:yes stop_codon:yes gene_type:complete
MKKVYGIAAIIILALGALFYFYLMSPQQGGRTEEVTTPAEGAVTAIISTSKGDITLELNSAGTPNTVANFMKLAQEGFYNGTKFHRVIPNFMIQGGDPLTKDNSIKARWGTGGPGYTFDDEIYSSNQNNIGTIAMANAGPNTNGSQFFINVADNNFLDEKHTVFGKVVSGMEVVTEIVNVPTEGPDRPVDDVVINSITIQ